MNAGMRRSPTKSLVFSCFWRRELPSPKKGPPAFRGGKFIVDGKIRPLKQVEHGKSIGDDGVAEIM